MTTIYKDYYYCLQNNIINLDDVDFSVRVLENYEPDPNHLLEDLNTAKYDLTSLFISNDMKKLSMSEIIDRVKENINNSGDASWSMMPVEDEEENNKGLYFVVYDTNTSTLCFGEDLGYFNRRM